MGDKLFNVRNSFYLGAFQTCISECSTVTGLSDAERIERDVFLYRSYIELGTYDVRAACCRCLLPAGASRHWAALNCPREGAVRRWHQRRCCGAAALPTRLRSLLAVSPAAPNPSSWSCRR